MKTVLVTGCTGQTGSYLCQLLVANDYKVVGLVRRSSVDNTKRLGYKARLILEDGDLTDAHSVNRVFEKYKPDYCFNLGAQSFVSTSFNQPGYTFQVNTIGLLNILEAIRTICPQCRLLHASTSEMFGSNYDEKWIDEYEFDNSEENLEKYQDENTEFRPESPYAISKVAAHQLCQLYRKAYGLFIVSAISFNHESPRRGDEFVTQKIIKYVQNLARAKKFSKDGDLSRLTKLKLGNIDASRDWSHALDIVRGYIKAIMYDTPDDYVFSSQVSYTVREFLEKAFNYVGLDWKDFVEIDSCLMRPSEVQYLRGISEKARKVLGWQPEYDLDALIEDMMEGE